MDTEWNGEIKHIFLRGVKCVNATGEWVSFLIFFCESRLNDRVVNEHPKNLKKMCFD